MLKNVLFLSCLAIGLMACDAQKDLRQQKAALTNPQSILNEFNEGKPLGFQGELFSGTVDFLLLEDSVLLVHLASPALEEDLVYGLFFNDEAYAMEPTTWTDAQVLYLNNQLVVSNVDDGQDLWLKLANATASDSLHLQEIDATYEGYGLSRTPIARERGGLGWNDPVVYGPKCTCESPNNVSHCDSGGTGASTCSTSTSDGSCTVTCDPTYYVACCDNDPQD